MPDKINRHGHDLSPVIIGKLAGNRIKDRRIISNFVSGIKKLLACHRFGSPMKIYIGWWEWPVPTPVLLARPRQLRGTLRSELYRALGPLVKGFFNGLSIHQCDS